MAEQNTRKRAARRREEESALALRKQREKNNMDNYGGVKRARASNRTEAADAGRGTETETETEAESTTAVQRSAVLEHGHLWEIMEEEALVGDVSRGSGVYCAGDYIYPSSFPPAPDTSSTPTVVSSFLDRHAERAFVR